MRILITGGLGFQGAHLASRLIRHGHEVLLFNTPSRRAQEKHSLMLLNDGLAGMHSPAVIWGSVLSQSVVEKAVESVDYVVHMAALANPDACSIRPDTATLVNVRGTLSVLDNALVFGKRLLHVSSCEVYGTLLEQQTEDAAFHPPHVYGATKAAADLLVQAYQREYTAPIIIARPCNVYGPGQRYGKDGAVIPTMSHDAIHKRSVTLRGGAQAREWLHINDLVDAYVKIITHPTLERGVFNIGSGESVSIGDIAGHIAAYFGVPVVREEPRRAEPASFALDSTSARQELAWSPTTTFTAGLQAYLAWAKEALA